MTSFIPEQRDIFSIGRLNAEVRAVLETSFPLIWVEGEISNLANPRSGHLYFSLKDTEAQVTFNRLMDWFREERVGS